MAGIVVTHDDFVHMYRSITSTTITILYQNPSQLAYRAGKMYVIADIGNANTTSTYLGISSDNGVTWTFSLVVGAGTIHPTIHIDPDGRIWIVYWKGNLPIVTPPLPIGNTVLRYSLDEGDNWSAENIIDPTGNGSLATPAYVAMDKDGTLWLVQLYWLVPGVQAMGAFKSSDLGVTWSPSIDITPGASTFKVFLDKETLSQAFNPGNSNTFDMDSDGVEYAVGNSGFDLACWKSVNANPYPALGTDWSAANIICAVPPAVIAQRYGFVISDDSIKYASYLDASEDLVLYNSIDGEDWNHVSTTPIP